MLVTVFATFCCAVIGYFLSVTEGFSIALTATALPHQWLAFLSIAKAFSFVLIVLFVCRYLFVKYRSNCQRTERLPYSLLFALMSLVLGVWWASGAHRQFIEARIMLPKSEVRQGVVVGLPDAKGEQVSFLFQPTGGSRVVEFGWREVPLRVTWIEPSGAIVPGQVWQLPLKVWPSESVAISGVGFVQTGAEKPQLLGSKITYHWIRSHLKQRILALAAEQSATPLLLALLLGDRSLLSTGTWQLLSDTGTTHLIAISGLHIGLIAGFTYFLVSLLMAVGLKFDRLQLPYVPISLVAHISALVAAWGYGALAGYSVPTQRACLTVTVVVFLRVFYPVIKPWVSVLISAAIILLFDPVAVVSASFWLTFTAVCFIFLVLQGRVGRLHAVFSWVRVQLALFFGLLPLSIWYFGKVSLLSVLSNLVAVPVVGWLIVPLSFLYAVLIYCGGLLESVAAGILGLLNIIASGLILGLELVQSLGATLLFPKPSNLSVLLAVMGAVLLSLPRAVSGKWVAVLMFVPLFTANIRGTPEKSIEGLASNQVLVAIDQGSSLILVGSRDQSAHRVQSLLIRYLQRKGIKNQLKEPVFNLYRQWISAEYFVLRITLQLQKIRQREAIAIEELLACRGADIEVSNLYIKPLVNAGDGRCQLLFIGEWGRHLFVAQGAVQQQLFFLDANSNSLTDGAVEVMWVSGSAPLSGALLNVVDPKAVFVGGAGEVDVATMERLTARGIESWN